MALTEKVLRYKFGYTPKPSYIMIRYTTGDPEILGLAVLKPFSLQRRSVPQLKDLYDVCLDL